MVYYPNTRKISNCTDQAPNFFHSLFPVAPSGARRHLQNASFHFSFLILYTVGKTPWAGDQPAARPLPTLEKTQIKRRQTSIPQAGFESTTPMFGCVKSVHASDSAATVGAQLLLYPGYINNHCNFTHIYLGARLAWSV
jgi:hypothetical protein